MAEIFGEFSLVAYQDMKHETSSRNSENIRNTVREEDSNSSGNFRSATFLTLRFGIASARIAGQTAVKVRIAGISHRSVPGFLVFGWNRNVLTKLACISKSPKSRKWAEYGFGECGFKTPSSVMPSPRRELSELLSA